MSILQTIVLLLKLVIKAFKWGYNCSRSRAGQIGWCARKFQRKESQTQTLSWLIYLTKLIEFSIRVILIDLDKLVHHLRPLGVFSQIKYRC